MSTTETFKQIGNAVPCGLARSLVLAQLTQSEDISRLTKSAIGNRPIHSNGQERETR